MTRTQVRASTCKHFLVDYTSLVFILKRVTYDADEPLCPDCKGINGQSDSLQSAMEALAMASDDMEGMEEEVAPFQPESAAQDNAAPQAFYLPGLSVPCSTTPPPEVQRFCSRIPACLLARPNHSASTASLFIPSEARLTPSARPARPTAVNTDLAALMTSMNINRFRSRAAGMSPYADLRRRTHQYRQRYKLDTGQKSEASEQEVMDMVKRVSTRCDKRGRGSRC